VQQTWYGIARKCGECETDSNLHEMAFSADGELSFAFYCPKCKKDFVWRVFACQLQRDALVRDLEKCHKGKIQPVVALPVITPKEFTDEDLKTLKDFFITPPDKEKPN